jgi:hypothetical protein
MWKMLNDSKTNDERQTYRIFALRWGPGNIKKKSRRRYNGEELKSSQLRRIQSFCKDFRPFSSARAVMVKESPDNVFKGIIGSYGVIKGARSFIAFVGDTRSAYVQEQVGYTGEGIILQAEVMNLNTCWVGGTFRREISPPCWS